MNQPTARELAQRPDCPDYFTVGGDGVIYSRDRMRTKEWAHGASGRQKRIVRKKLRRMAKEAAA